MGIEGLAPFSAVFHSTIFKLWSDTVENSGILRGSLHAF